MSSPQLILVARVKLTSSQHCGQQNIDFVIGSVNVNNTAGLAPFAPKNGFVASFPTTPFLYESGGFRFNYDCNFGVSDITL